jgi:hypothetical protein
MARVQKMAEISFDTFRASLSRPSQALTLGNRLKLPQGPNPFVAPTLRVIEPDLPRPLDAEVLFIKASAAVGKSTIANHLANTLQIPLLDLARVPVSTGSLKALLLDVSGLGNPLEAFHAGRLPIIVDALDEGRLLSGEQGFESFLETVGELLGENRSVLNRPKLILLGRYDSIEIAEMFLGLSGNNVTICKIEVAFFGKEAAWHLIEAYADVRAKPGAQYRQHPEPVRRLIGAYFAATEAALGLPAGSLWTSDQGKAFAGYAPVLAAVGSLIAELDNFQDLTNRLESSGAKEAWAVIDTVLSEIIERERNKFASSVRSQLTGAIPDEAYDKHEQFTLLTQFVHRQPLQGSGRVKLTGMDQAKYFSMVKANIPEHPFVRNQDFGNSVLGSVVIAHAIEHDLLRGLDPERTNNLSRQPFLWRALSQRLDGDPLIDGTYLGFILNSLWNDPIQPGGRITIRSANDGDAIVQIPIDAHKSSSIRALAPLSFYAQIKDCDIDIADDVKLVGDGPQSSTVFYVRGATTIVSSAIEVSADQVRFDGNVWFESERISAPPRLRLYAVNGTQIGWGGEFANRYPWNEIQSTLAPPYDVRIDDPLGVLLVECARRLPPAGTITLNPDFSVPADDPRVRWIVRQFSDQFRLLIKLMIDHGIASAEPMDAAGTGKVRIRFEITWSDLASALNRSDGTPRVMAFLGEARHKIAGG